MIKIQNIYYQNIYYMLAYAFQVLNEDCYAKIAAEQFDNMADLCAAILVKGIANQIKRGLGKDYVVLNQPLSSPRGKIEISASLQLQVLLKKQLVCEFDDFSDNTYFNQILKTTALLLIKSEGVRIARKHALKKVMLYFNEVGTIKPQAILWSGIRYHRNNATYKMLINICYLVIKGLLPTEQRGSLKLATYLDDLRMSRLYEKFVLEFYRKHYPQFNASPSQIDWDVDDGATDLLPIMKTDITLHYKEKTLIIDTKYYGRTLQINPLFNSRTIHSNNMYQIFTYVKNRDVQASGNVTGVLLYAKTDEEITPDNDYMISGNKISVKTLDLNTDFSFIAKQLNVLAEGLTA